MDKELRILVVEHDQARAWNSIDALIAFVNSDRNGLEQKTVAPLQAAE